MLYPGCETENTLQDQILFTIIATIAIIHIITIIHIIKKKNIKHTQEPGLKLLPSTCGILVERKNSQERRTFRGWEYFHQGDADGL